MSFLRMQESPSSATLGDSCMRWNDRNEAFVNNKEQTRTSVLLFGCSHILSE
ncbi:MAG: hypothetical protein NT007_03240 [Candidatus Kapabacteria bacterium]|nr:hypothetical protein [Candidatus Kapabacteria bacterium]